MVLRRLFKKARRAHQPRRRQLLVEHLARRELFAVDPLGVITGTVFTDLANDGVINSIVDTSGTTVDDPTHSGVAVELYQDNNNDGAIDGGDTLVDTVMTNGAGEFRFEGLSAGDYLLSQEAIAGLLAPTGPVPVTVADDGGQQVTGIDDFSEAFQLLTVANSAAPDESDSAGGGTATTILGGERDLVLAINDGGDSAELEVDGQLKFSTQLGVTATALVQYDGVDGSSTLDPTGLGGVDLTEMNQGAGLLLGAFADLAGGTLTVRIYTDADNASEATINIPAAATIEEFFVPFSDFTMLGGAAGPADFNNVGAIEGFLDGVPGLDARVSVISSLAPVEVTQNLANVEPIFLGDTIFRDSNDNGVQDAGEAGIAGVDLNLYADTNENGVFDSGTDTLVDATTSGVNGAYLFENLVPGDYIVQIPSDEFSLGQPLFGFATSQTAAADPNDNVDGDNNGEELDGQGVVSRAITLISQGEPTDDGDADPSTNLSLDFGFVPEVDLVVEKELTTTDPVAGGEANFQLTITNNGPLEATNVTLLDPLPDGLTFNRVENVPDGVTIDVSENELTADIGTLATGAGNAITFNVIVIVADGSPGVTYTNEVTITADQRDIDTANNNGTAEFTTLASDLRITKTSDSDPVTAGETLTYTLQVFNDGPDDAAGVVVTDTLPADVTFVSAAIGENAADVNHDNGVVTAEIGNLASGASETITIQVTVASDAETSLDNIATVTSTPDSDTDPTNNSVTETTDVERMVDLEVTKDDDVTEGIPGQSMTYTLTAMNSGPSDASGVQIVDTLPENFTLTSAVAGGIPFTNADGVVTFNVGDLASGDTVSVTLTGRISASATGTLLNAVTIGGNESDSDPSNDTATLTTSLTPQFDLAIDKSASSDEAVPGDTFTYEISLDNSGPSHATNVVVTDVLPDGVTFVSGSLGGVDATVDGSTVTFDLDTVNAGAGIAGTLVVSIASTTTGTLVNQVTVSADPGDTNPDNDSDSVHSTLTPTVDLEVSKNASQSVADTGDELTYTIVVANSGPSAATGVTAVDTLPAGVTFVSGIGPDGQALSANGRTVNVTIGTLDADATAQFTITAAINADVTQDQTNNVVVATPLNETNSNNNSASATTTIERNAANIEGVVYIDANNDGVPDPEETPLPGVTLNLTGTDSEGESVSQTTTTDANGVYRFTGLSTGTYTIEQIPPETNQNGVLIGPGRRTVGENATARVEENGFSEIVLEANAQAVDFNFAEIPLPISIRYLMSQNCSFLDQRQ